MQWLKKNTHIPNTAHSGTAPTCCQRRAGNEHCKQACPMTCNYLHVYETFPHWLGLPDSAHHLTVFHTFHLHFSQEPLPVRSLSLTPRFYHSFQSHKRLTSVEPVTPVTISGGGVPLHEEERRAQEHPYEMSSCYVVQRCWGCQESQDSHRHWMEQRSTYREKTEPGQLRQRASRVPCVLLSCRQKTPTPSRQGTYIMLGLARCGRIHTLR